MIYSFKRTKSTTGAEYPATVQAKIDACPVAGGGLNFELCKVANELRHNVDAQRGLEILTNLAIERGRPRHTAASEARRLVDSKWNRDGRTAATPIIRAPKTPANLDKIRRIVSESTETLASLRDQSLINVDACDGDATDDIIDLLFPDADTIFVGSLNTGTAGTHAELYRDGLKLHKLSHIVPNPLRFRYAYDAMTGEPGLARQLGNIRYRRWLVIEFDATKFARDKVTPTFWQPLIEEWERRGITPKDAQARLILKLAGYGNRLGMIVDSGDKSLHAWFPAFTWPKSRQDRFMGYAMSIGADPATRTPSQLVRMPHGTRADGTRQLVHYLDPQVLHLKDKE